MKLSLIITIILLSLPLTLAYEEWHWHGDSFTTEGHNYSIRIMNGQLRFDQDSNTYLVELGDCEDTLTTELCFLEQVIDFDEGYGPGYGRFNPINGDPEPSLKVKITNIVEELPTPSISVSRATYKTNPTVGESINISLTIKNQGSASVTNMYFNEKYDGDLELDNLTGANRVGFKEINKQFNTFYDDYNHTITYTITPQSIMKLSSETILKYSFDGEINYVTVPPIVLNVPSLFDIVMTTPEKKSIDEDSSFTITISNTDPLAFLNITKLKLVIPDDVDVNFPEEFSQRGIVYMWEGGLSVNSSIEFDFRINSRYADNFPIDLTYEAVLNEKEFTGSESTEFITEIGVVTPTITLSKSAVGPLELYNITLDFQNTDSKLLFYDIEGNIESEAFAPISFNIDVLRASKSTEILETVPYGHPIYGTIPITVSGKYRSKNGQKFDIATSTNINIGELNAPFSILQEIEDKVFETGESVPIKIRIQKTGGVDRLSIFNDIQDNDLQKTVVFNDGQNETVAWDFNQTITENATLTTTITYVYEGHVLTDVYTKQIIVKTPLVNESIEEEIEVEINVESENVSITDSEEYKKVEKAGEWLVDFISSIETFFSNLFS